MMIHQLVCCCAFAISGQGSFSRSARTVARRAYAPDRRYRRSSGGEVESAFHCCRRATGNHFNGSSKFAMRAPATSLRLSNCSPRQTKHLAYPALSLSDASDQLFSTRAPSGSKSICYALENGVTLWQARVTTVCCSSVRPVIATKPSSSICATHCRPFSCPQPMIMAT